MSRDARKMVLVFLTISDTNRSAQSEKSSRNLKFLIKVEEELYDLCSQNEGADQLCIYWKTDLCLFLNRQNPGFLLMQLKWRC